MSVTGTIKSGPWRGLSVDLLRAVHLWTGRQYRRALIRRELRRIGRELVAERRARDRAEKQKLGKQKAEMREKAKG